MAVQIIEQNEALDVEKSHKQTIYSTNKVIQTREAKDVAVFTFDNLIIPETFKAVRIAFVSDTTTVPAYEGYNCNSWGISLYDVTPDSSVTYKIFKLLFSDYSQALAQRYRILFRAFSVNSSTLNTIDKKILSHIGDFEEHVSANNATLTSHIGDDTHVTSDEKDLLQTLVVPQTRLFSTKTDEMTTNEYANCLYFSISKKHFTQGKLQKIEIPYKSGGSAYSKVWLCLQFYNSATEVKTFEDCIFSKNYQSQTTSGGTLVFEFDNVQIPYDYSFVKIMLAQNDTTDSEEPPTTLPSGNLEIRITPLKTTTLTFDLDECEVKGSNGTIYNWLVYLNAETKISFLDEYSLLLQEVKELKNRIEQLESNS